MFETALAIEALEEDLRAVLEVESSAVSALLKDLLADPESAVHITALNWLVGRQETVVDPWQRP